VVVEVGSERCDSEGHDTDIENAHDMNPQNKADQIDTLKELLKKQGKACLLTWLQQTLLDACCVKMNGNELFKSNGDSLEPVPYHFNYINQSIPMVAWNKNQESGLQTETFMLLLHKLGFHLATDVGKCFPRIPHFWSADHIYNLALKIGPVKKEDLKMDLSILETPSGIAENQMITSDICMGGVGTSDFALNETSPANMDTLVSSPSPSCSKNLEPEVDHTFEVPTSFPDSTPFAMPTPTNSWIQLALTSKKSSESKSKESSSRALTSSSSATSMDMSLDPTETGHSTSSSLERMQISDDSQ